MATMEYAHRVMVEFEAQLLANPNVAFISVVSGLHGLDLTDRERFHIQVGVYSYGVQVKALSAYADQRADYSKFVPASLSLGESDEDVNVEIVETDEIVALGYFDDRRPAEGGNSTSVHNLSGSGTLGSRVTANGQEGFFITNWHVAHGGGASKGSAQLQRGRGDGGQLPGQRIGELYWWALNEFLDAAIVKADRVDQLTYVLRCWGTKILGFETPRVNMQVKKCGRTSQATVGTIKSVTATVKVNGYPGGIRVFRDQIQMTSMLRPGDSGSVLLTNNNKAVGLCFAGSSSDSFANKFSRVLSAAQDGSSIEEDGSVVEMDGIEIGWDPSLQA